ncbi:MAG: PfkB family carbohydrate kinase [Candidatus Promineifilaceae bacterium]
MKEHPLYLAVGHVSQDIIPGGWKVGGTVSFALRVADVLGCETRLITSAAANFPLLAALPSTILHVIPAPETTIFENVQTPRGRVQTLHGRALPLEPTHLPPQWPLPDIVHLSPIAAEVSPAWVDYFRATSPNAVGQTPLIGLTPQGWLRTWDEQGHVTASAWNAAAKILPLAHVTILSQEDWPDEATMALFQRCAPLLVVTEGANGCQVYINGEAHHVPVDPVTEVETTGAGDVFAAAFLICLYHTGDPLASAHAANQIAAQSVTQTHLAAKIEAVKKLEFKARARG